MKTAFSEALRPARIELTTFGSGGQRSIQLSYGRERKPNIAQFNDLAIECFNDSLTRRRRGEGDNYSSYSSDYVLAVMVA
jgi:hypothetical protein